MNNYSFSDDAIQDIEEICEYIAQINTDVALRFFDTMRQKCKNIANFPNIGKSYDYLVPNLRGFIVENYIVFYSAREDGIDVLRVVSGYRDLEQLFSEYLK